MRCMFNCCDLFYCEEAAYTRFPACHSLHATLCVPLPVCHSLHATPCVPLPACHSLRATLCVPLPACHSLRATPCVPLSVCHSLRATPCEPLPLPASPCHSLRAPATPCVPLSACHSLRATPCVTPSKTMLLSFPLPLLKSPDINSLNCPYFGTTSLLYRPQGRPVHWTRSLCVDSVRNCHNPSPSFVPCSACTSLFHPAQWNICLFVSSLHLPLRHTPQFGSCKYSYSLRPCGQSDHQVVQCTFDHDKMEQYNWNFLDQHIMGHEDFDMLSDVSVGWMGGLCSTPQQPYSAALEQV